IRVEKAAAIGAPFFDDLLRSHRTLRDGLGGDDIHYGLAVGIKSWFAVSIYALNLLRFDQFHGVIGLQILDYALRDEEQRTDNAKRQEYPKAAAEEIHPEISQRLHLAAGDAADECNGQHDSCRCRSKVVKGEAGHLSEITHRGLAGVGLPV